jgi:protein-tyrosine phosphatase
VNETAGPQSILAGARNFRAVKPYETATGGRLRANTLFRSGELSRLSDADLEIIAGLKIRVICDLRTAREQGEFLSRWPDGTGHRHLVLAGSDESDAGPHKIFELIASHPGETGGLKAMDLLYRRKPRAFAKTLAVLFETILAGDALPLLIHCHAGKDRTGFIIAMLLAAAGVSKADIVDDYVTTAVFFPPEIEARALAGWARRSFGREIDPASALPMVDARRGYIEAAYEEIAAGWGSVEGYLRHAGLTDVARAKLQSMLVK